ncbi:MAG: EFR1 family ferrodoxin [Treponema sp.]|jgi:NAD-dependent dihydropyrimidine dehydrogenase PreA subunit|nr:EFR1 family ferrodoxin [Treponema sp.]
MKRVLLIVWSGTGNTLKVAELIRDSFRVRGYGAEIVDCTRVSGIAENQAFGAGSGEGDGAVSGAGIAGADIIGLGYPVYAFNVPLPFLRYVKALGIGDKPVFVFKTSGEPTFFNDGSSHSLIKLLTPPSGSCTLLGEYHFLMPYNIVFRFPDNLIKQMYGAAKLQSGMLADNVVAGKTSFIKYTLLHRLVSLVFRIQRPGARLNGRFYGVRRDRCTLCLRCLRDCPAGNIRMVKGRFRFGGNCMMCMRCSLYCPADALTIGLLNLWRVNGPFRFEVLEKDGTLDGRFITEKSRGLYRIYLPKLNPPRSPAEPPSS